MLQKTSLKIQLKTTNDIDDAVHLLRERNSTPLKLVQGVGCKNKRN